LNNNTPVTATSKTALILPGGGARAAYQVGVLKALAEQNPRPQQNPFPILSGTSAGALNAVGLASRERGFEQNCQWLEELWLNLTPERVYRSDWSGVLRNCWRLFLSLVNAGVAVGRPVALLDNMPLKQLLNQKIDFSGIGRNIQAGTLEAISVTAMNYSKGVSVSFFQGGPDSADWQRWRRHGVPTPLQLRHLLASTAIPTVFPPQRIGRHYYGDGALRQMTPISPALHLGADKILIISTTGHKRDYHPPPQRARSPAFGQIIGHLLNSAFVDSLETDIEHLEQMNALLTQIPGQIANSNGRTLKNIDIHVVSPSQDIDALADEYTQSLPRSIRSFLRLLGGSSSRGGINVASYLLFTPEFCQRLIDLGYRDGCDQREKLAPFLSPTAPQ